MNAPDPRQRHPTRPNAISAMGNTFRACSTRDGEDKAGNEMAIQQNRSEVRG